MLTQQADWKKWARAMSDAGLAVFKASENKDVKALVAANSQLVESCEGCHKQYKPALPSEGIAHQHIHVERH
jgi:cytochrome c556